MSERLLMDVLYTPEKMQTELLRRIEANPEMTPIQLIRDFVDDTAKALKIEELASRQYLCLINSGKIGVDGIYVKKVEK